MQLACFPTVCALGTLFGCATVPAAGSRGTGATSEPRALRFELQDVTGRTVRTGDYAGRVLLVDLWATWCRPCEASMPFYAGLERRLGQEGLSILAVSVDEHDEDVVAFLEGRDLPFPVLRDPGGRVVGTFDVDIQTMPTAVIVGRDGYVRYVHSGFVAEDRERIEREVRAALDRR